MRKSALDAAVSRKLRCCAGLTPADHASASIGCEPFAVCSHPLLHYHFMRARTPSPPHACRSFIESIRLRCRASRCHSLFRSFQSIVLQLLQQATLSYQSPDQFPWSPPGPICLRIPSAFHFFRLIGLRLDAAHLERDHEISPEQPIHPKTNLVSRDILFL